MFSILVVDDNAHFRALLRMALGSRYAVVEAASGAEGLRAIDPNSPFAAVISDMNMPGMNGIQFLSAMKQRSPDTVRIMLTGQDDQTTAIDAINEGSIFRFLTKTAKMAQIIHVMEAAIEQHRVVTAERQLLEQTLSASIHMLMDLLATAVPESFGRAQTVREMTRTLAAYLEIRDTWELEMGAMLARIGELTLPASLLARMREGLPLDVRERQASEQVPEFGHKMLAQIPRFETVGRIVLYQAKHYDGSGFPPDPCAGPALPLGARMLCLLMPLAEMQAGGMPAGRAFKELEKNQTWFDPKILEAATECFARRAVLKRAVKLDELRIGQRLVESVVTLSDLNIVSAGTIISAAILQRLRNFDGMVGLVQPIFVEELNISA
jgi:response regulator RpfG family c-di-GMP phosphodiesterase